MKITVQSARFPTGLSSYGLASGVSTKPATRVLEPNGRNNWSSNESLFSTEIWFGGLASFSSVEQVTNPIATNGFNEHLPLLTASCGHTDRATGVPEPHGRNNRSSAKSLFSTKIWFDGLASCSSVEQATNPIATNGFHEQWPLLTASRIHTDRATRVPDPDGRNNRSSTDSVFSTEIWFGRLASCPTTGRASNATGFNEHLPLLTASCGHTNLATGVPEPRGRSNRSSAESLFSTGIWFDGLASCSSTEQSNKPDRDQRIQRTLATLDGVVRPY